MDLESLPNELLLDLFQYFSTIDVLHAFFNLNTRFTELLITYFQTYLFDFQSTSKQNFDSLCHDYLPIFSTHIRSIRLSENDETPQAIERFYAHGWSFGKFPHLKILHLDQAHSIIRLLDDRFTQLTHLYLTRFVIDDQIDDSSKIACLLEQLPNLICCHLDLTDNDELYSCIGKIHSPKLKSLSLRDLDCSVKSLCRLIPSTSSLQSLEVSISETLNPLWRPSIYFPSMKTLIMNFSGSLDSLTSLLETMPHLVRLRIDLTKNYIDGDQWEFLISHYLIHLKTFQLKMVTFLPNRNDIEEQIDVLLFSFSTRFWLEEHRWFIQCDWSSNENSSMVNVYTLPYAFSIFSQIKESQSKSTFPSVNHHWSFDQISHIYANQSQFSFECQNLFHIELTISSNYINNSHARTYDRLKYLSLVLSDDCKMHETYMRIQSLFHLCPHLYSLSLFSWLVDYLCLLSIPHSSIRRLDLRGPNAMFDRKQCFNISQSALGRQCEVLLVGVKERENLSDILHNMPQLRSLTVRFFISKEFPQSFIQMWIR